MKRETTTLVLVCLAVAMGGTACAPSSSSPTVAHWTFEEGPVNSVAMGTGSIRDSAGNHHGTPFNGPSYRRALTPDGGRLGLQFSDRSQRVFVPDDPALSLTGSLTLEAFVIRDPGPVRFSYIVAWADDDPGPQGYLLNVFGSGNVRFVVGASRVSESDVRSPDPLPEGQLTHIAATLDDDTGEQKLYINGVLVATATTSVRAPAALDPRQNPGIGIGNTQGDKYKEAFNGIIAEVRISNVALKPDRFLYQPPAGE